MKTIKKLTVFLILFSVWGLYHAFAGQTQRTPQSLESSSWVSSIPDASVYSKVFVISDVHGMYGNLQPLLRAAGVMDENNNWIAGNSLLVVTGDSIDKGPQSIEVLDLWIRLQSQARMARGDVIHTLGNHEAEFLANPEGDKKAQALLDEMKSKDIPVSDLTGTGTPRGNFLHSEPVALVVGKWLFSHSGYYPELSWSDFTQQAEQSLGHGRYGDAFLIGANSILETKDWEKNDSTLQGVLNRMDSLGIYGEVFGHQPGAFGIQGRSAAKGNGRLIKIDNGMAPEAGENSGSILVFKNPTEMNANSYPSIEVIEPNGSSNPLIPE